MSSALSAACAGLSLWGVACASAPATPAAPTPALVVEGEAAGCGLMPERAWAFALLEPGGAVVGCGGARVSERRVAASTFKVANALIALETGVVADEREELPWDGELRWLEAWNQPTSLATGMKNSTVWFYQEMARRIGPARMRAWVERLGYGNANTGGEEDLTSFWLRGPLEISALEQVAFLDRLRRRALPLSRRSQDLVAEAMVVERGEGWVLRAKSGALLPINGEGVMTQPWASPAPGEGERTGWYVGWLERDEGRVAVFAFHMAMEGPEDLPRRAQHVRALLAAQGLLEPKAP